MSHPPRRFCPPALERKAHGGHQRQRRLRGVEPRVLDHHFHIAFHHQRHGLGQRDHFPAAAFDLFHPHVQRALGGAYGFQPGERLAIFEINADFHLGGPTIEIENAHGLMTHHPARALIRQVTVRNAPHLRTYGFFRHVLLPFSGIHSPASGQKLAIKRCQSILLNGLSVCPPGRGSTQSLPAKKTRR